MSKLEDVDVDFIIDGSTLEGGGQVMRNTVALASLLRKSVRVHSIRAKRSRPGLARQHLCGIELVARMHRAQLEGAAIGSDHIVYRPNDFADQVDFCADTQTAGSTCLLVQIALPTALFAPHPVTLTLRGGTNAAMAPQVDYFTLVLLPTLQRLTNVTFDLRVNRRGYYPKGGGELLLRTQPLQEAIRPLTIVERGHVMSIYIRSFVANLPKHIAEQMLKSAMQVLQERVTAAANDGHDVKYVTEVVVETECIGAGTGLIIVAETSTGCLLAGSALGERKKKAKIVGKEAAEMLCENLAHGGCVDEYLADQLIIFMALAEGKSTMRCGPLSLHTQTAIHFCTMMSGAKFAVEAVENADSTFLIECEGIGLATRKSE